MASNYNAPPELKDESKYETWKKELSLWQIFTDISKSKQAPAICLSLSGRAHEAALEINIDKLHSDTGVQELITKLDSSFLKDSEQRIYVAYDTFEKFKRKDNMSINDYIIEFEKLNLKLKNIKWLYLMQFWHIVY